MEVGWYIDGFYVGLPRIKSSNDALWVKVDRLTKSACFILMNCRWEMEQLARAYIKCVVRFHGVPHTIVSDRVEILVICRTFGDFTAG